MWTQIPLHDVIVAVGRTESNATTVQSVSSKSNYDSIEKIRTRTKLKATEKENRMHATTILPFIVIACIFYGVCVCEYMNKCVCVYVHVCGMAWHGG